MLKGLSYKKCITAAMILLKLLAESYFRKHANTSIRFASHGLARVLIISEMISSPCVLYHSQFILQRVIVLIFNLVGLFLFLFILLFCNRISSGGNFKLALKIPNIDCFSYLILP